MKIKGNEKNYVKLELVEDSVSMDSVRVCACLFGSKRSLVLHCMDARAS